MKQFKYYPLDQSVTLLKLLYDIWLAMLMKEDPFFAVVKQHLKWNNPYLNQWTSQHEFLLKLCQSLMLSDWENCSLSFWAGLFKYTLFLVSSKLFRLHFRFIAFEINFHHRMINVMPFYNFLLFIVTDTKQYFLITYTWKTNGSVPPPTYIVGVAPIPKVFHLKIFLGFSFVGMFLHLGFPLPYGER